MSRQRIVTFLLVCIYVLVSINSFAARITGIVTDEKKEPMIGTLVILKNTDKGTQTDADGKFEITGVEDGTYEVLFTMLTYKKVLKTVTVLKGQDVVLEIVMKEEGKNLNEVTIKSTKITNTENAVLMEMRKSNSIVSGVSAQQISKTMDRNAAEVVKRVPGVTIMDDQFIMVRGMNDRYNSVWLNDVAAPSSEVDKKSFSFDVIPSGQIDRILVYKTPAPELPGDFAGGMVKIYTTSIPDKNTYTAGISMSSRQNSTGTPFNYNTASKTDWLGYDDGSRAMPSNLPEKVLKGDASQDNAAITKSFKNNWGVNTKSQPLDVRFNMSASNVMKIKQVRLGNTFGVSYSNVKTNYNIEQHGWDSVTKSVHFSDKNSINTASLALMDNVAAAWGNNKIEFKNLYNQFGRSSMVYRTTVADTELITTNEKYYVMGYDSRRVYAGQLTGSHKSSDDRLKYTWALGYTDLFKNMPDMKRIRYDELMVDSPYSVATANAVDPVYGGGRVYSTLKENIKVFSHQVTKTFTIAKFEFDVTAGNYIEQKNRSYNLRQFSYTIDQSGPTGANARRIKKLGIDEVFAEQNVGGKGLFNIDETTNDYDKYDASNRLIASFIAAKLPFMHNNLIVYGGVRHENNTYKLTASKNYSVLSPEVVTNFFLPSLNISYNINSKNLIRLAYGKTLNRPEFRENSPFYFYDLENRWGIKGTMFGDIVNSASGDTLSVAQIHNLDARWEWYPSSTEVIQAGVFYKKIKDPIQNVITVPEGPAREYSFTNFKEGYSYGVEVDMRKNLVFLDGLFGTNQFKDFSIIGNAAFIKSSVTPYSNVKTKDIPLQGQSPYMFNAGLYYQGSKTGLQATLVYNVFGPRIFVIGATDKKVGNIWELPFHSLDLIASKTFFKHYTLTAGVQNLLDGKVRQYQDANYDNKILTGYESNPQIQDRPILSYKPGKYYTIGLKVRF